MSTTPSNSDDLSTTVPPEAAEVPGHTSLPYHFARRHGVLVNAIENGRARITYRHGANIGAFSELRRHLGMPLLLEQVTAEEFDTALTRRYESGSSQALQVMDDIEGDLDLKNVARALADPEDLLDSEDDAPVIRLINALFTESIKEGASDIHIESFENRLVVRFRIDGVLREILQPPRAIAPLLVSRIKVMAHLDIAEKRLPQDGRISLKVAGRAVDIRVSTLPSGFGERVVLRLLDKKAGRLDLEQLGMTAEDCVRIDRSIRRPHGILLVTGPTGSGKTTTLYAALSRLNDSSRNIVTVEDPIEYFINGIGQTQVNAKVELTFARGLRAILRQDPDVVMVGEIRDLETAQIAVQASLTGHLVLSTLHTNSAVSTITRLRDMGIEPFLLSSSLVGILAQRLIRLLCPHCKTPYTATEKECEFMGMASDQPPTLYAAQGCDHCLQLGYSGRSGIYEFVEIDESLRASIHDNSSEQEMLRHIRTQAPSIRMDGIRKVLEGNTTLEEVLRVTQED